MWVTLRAAHPPGPRWSADTDKPVSTKTMNPSLKTSGVFKHIESIPSKHIFRASRSTSEAAWFDVAFLTSGNSELIVLCVD